MMKMSLLTYSVYKCIQFVYGKHIKNDVFFHTIHSWPGTLLVELNKFARNPQVEYAKGQLISKANFKVFI